MPAPPRTAPDRVAAVTDLGAALARHQQALKQCRRCPAMAGPVVTGNPVASPILLLGQAPGDKEGAAGRPFAWTAGKTLFQWFARIGVDEQQFRRRVYMAAVCRCFPGKKARGGDRLPSPAEVANCAPWLAQELALLRPQLILPVGKLAIARFLEFERLTEVVGARHRIDSEGGHCDLIPLPHPSGASTWHRREPGLTLLGRALDQIAAHPAWGAIGGRHGATP